MKKSTILGIGTLIFGIGYLYFSNKESDNTMGDIKGLDVNFNPSIFLDHAVGKTKLPQKYKDGISTVGKHFVAGLMNRR